MTMEEEVTELIPDPPFLDPLPEPAGDRSLVLGCQGKAAFNKTSVLTHFSDQMKGNTPCVYKGLGAAPEEVRDLIAGVRVGSLAIHFATHGVAGLEFESMLSFLDTLFPGEFGELNHSRRFATSFVSTAVKLLKTHQVPGPSCF
jgi:hypothetical protein